MSFRPLVASLLALLVACGPGERPGPDGDGGTTGGTDGGAGGSDAGSAPDAGGGGGGDDCTATGATGSQGGDTCDDAIAVTLKCEGALEINGTTAGATNAVTQGSASSCRVSGRSPDRIYKVTVPAGRTMKATVASGDSTFDPAIMLLAADACGTELSACLASDDSGSATTENSVSHTAGERDATVFVVVDNYNDSSGPFTLRFTMPAPLTGDTCDNADALTSGTTLTEQTLDGAADDYASGTGCLTGRQERAYSISVPAGKVLRLNVAPDATLDPVINLVVGGASACAGTLTCAASKDRGSDGDAETLSWQNTGGSTADVIVLVEAYSATDTGAFSIVASLEDPPGPSLGGDTCDTAYGMNAPESLTAESFFSAADDLDGDEECLWALGGPDRTYSVVVPDGQTLTAAMDPTTEEDLSVYLVASAAACSASPLQCLAGDDSGYEGEAESVTYANTSGAAMTIIVVVDAPSSVGDDATYNLSISLAPNAP